MNVDEAIDTPEDSWALTHLHSIATQLGTALSFSFMVGTLEPGSNVEDEAIDAMRESWERLADKVLVFMGGRDDHP